jgi:hypothetical protein
MDIFGYYFNIAFPYKLINLIKTYNSKWITTHIKISSKRMFFKIQLVKECAKFVKGLLAHIYNILINSGMFPEKFKVARGELLYEKGYIYSIKNYRPISILYIFLNTGKYYVQYINNILKQT